MGQPQRGDDLTHAHIVELHRKIDLIVKILARQQDQIAKIAKVRTSDPNYRARRYMRHIIRTQRETLAKNKLYILQLENELHLRGL